MNIPEVEWTPLRSRSRAKGSHMVTRDDKWTSLRYAPEERASGQQGSALRLRQTCGALRRGSEKTDSQQ